MLPASQVAAEVCMSLGSVEGKFRCRIEALADYPSSEEVCDLLREAVQEVLVDVLSKYRQAVVDEMKDQV